MRNFLRLVHGVSIAPLNLALARRPQLWEQAPSLLGGREGPYREVESIILRFPDKRVLYQGEKATSFDSLENVDYPAYAQLPEARQLIMNILAAVAGERLGSVVIHRIPPGAAIQAHTDNVDLCAYYSRFHLVLQSDVGIPFCCGSEAECFEAGVLFWLDNSLEYDLKNDSREDIIHLVLDAKCAM